MRVPTTTVTSGLLTIFLWFRPAAQPAALGAMMLSSSVSGATITTVSVTGMPFTTAQRIFVPQKTDPVYGIQATVPVNSTLDRGMAVLLSYYVRSATHIPCTLGLRFEQLSSPWTGSFDAAATAPDSWRRIVCAFLIHTPAGTASFAPAAAGIRFRLGYCRQTLEIGGIEMTLFPGSKIDSLEAVAALSRDTTWRAEARRRIAQNRTGTFTVRVLDEAGAPVPGAAVDVTMTRHDFDFGSMLDDLILGSRADDLKYQAYARQMFNAATQRLYWAWNWTTESAIRNIERCIAWADSSGMRSRGHTIVYPTWWACPTWLQNYQNNPSVLRDTIADHVIEVAQRLEGRLCDWDVVNEMSHWTDLRDAVGGRQYYVEWYKLAKQYAPTTLAAVNEFANIENGGLDRVSIEAYKELVQYLIANDAPVEVLGFQGHFDSYTEPYVLWGILDEFAAFGRPMRVTELDVNVQNEQVQAEMLKDLLLAFYAHPSMVGVTLWGFWEGNMWNDRRGLVRRDWTPKPSYDVWQDLIYTQWWTPQQQMTTAASGAASCAGYRGRYNVRVQYGGRDTMVSAQFTRDADTAVVRLPVTLGAGDRPLRPSAGPATLRLPGGQVMRLPHAPAQAVITVLNPQGRMLTRTSLGAGRLAVLTDIGPGAAIVRVAGDRRVTATAVNVMLR